MAVKQEILYLFENIKFNLASAMEYRTNFIIQSISMFLNDSFSIIFWWILFDKFKTMNGWYFKDVLLLISVAASSIGLGRILFEGARKLHKKISEGGMDYYLVLPKSALLNSIVGINYTGIGDLSFGLLVGIFILDIKQYPLWILLMICGMIIYTSFVTLTNSLSFFIGRGEALSTSLELGIIIFSTYPFSLFEGISRFLLLTIIPAGFISGIPVELLKQFSLKWLLILIAFTIFIALLAYTFFKLGLRRYESGSLIVMRE